MDSFKQSYTNMISNEDMKFSKDGNHAQKFQEDNFFNFSPMVSNNTLSKVDIDTLFAIFYFQTDDYERLQAAKELKKRGWSFNKKYVVWFKRHGNPTEVHQLYERGDFLIFYSENKWKIKKKINFYFEYKHLEHEV